VCRKGDKDRSKEGRKSRAVETRVVGTWAFTILFAVLWDIPKMSTIKKKKELVA